MTARAAGASSPKFQVSADLIGHLHSNQLETQINDNSITVKSTSIFQDLRNLYSGEKQYDIHTKYTFTPSPYDSTKFDVAVTKREFSSEGTFKNETTIKSHFDKSSSDIHHMIRSDFASLSERISNCFLCCWPNCCSRQREHSDLTEPLLGPSHESMSAQPDLSSKGSYTLDNGDRYTGRCREDDQGTFVGQSTYTFNDGSTFSTVFGENGAARDKETNSQGTYTLNGVSYTGNQWRFSEKSVNSRYRDPKMASHLSHNRVTGMIGERRVYDGSIKNGSKVKGTYTFFNRDQFEGTFENDKMKQGKYSWDANFYCEGTFTNGKIDLDTATFYKGGKAIQRPTPEQITYADDGAIIFGNAPPIDETFRSSAAPAARPIASSPPKPKKPDLFGIGRNNTDPNQNDSITLVELPQNNDRPYAVSGTRKGEEVYRGGMSNGSKTEGTLLFSNSSRFEGRFKNDKMSEGNYFWKSGRLCCKAKFIDGRLDLNNSKFYRATDTEGRYKRIPPPTQDQISYTSEGGIQLDPQYHLRY